MYIDISVKLSFNIIRFQALFKVLYLWHATTMDDIKGYVKKAVEEGDLSELHHLFEENSEWTLNQSIYNWKNRTSDQSI